jgi:hypothetical protein
VAHASDALRRVERHAELYAAAVAAATGTDGGGGRCSGKPQLAGSPMLGPALQPGTVVPVGSTGQRREGVHIAFAQCVVQ